MVDEYLVTVLVQVAYLQSLSPQRYNYHAVAKASAGVNLGNVVSLLGGAAPHSSNGGSVSGGASSTIGKRRRKVAYSSSFKEPPSSSITGTFKSGVAAAAMAYCEAMHHLYIPNP